MNTLFAIFCMAFAAVGMFLDVTSTVAFTRAGVSEKNPRYRNADGSANIPKLIREKFIAFGIFAVIAFVLYFSNLDFTPFPKSIAFVLFLAVGLRHFIVWRHNRKIVERGKK